MPLSMHSVLSLQACSYLFSFDYDPDYNVESQLKVFIRQRLVFQVLRRRHRPGIKIFELKKSHPQVCLWHNALSNVSLRRKNLLFTHCLGDLCKTT